MCTMIAVSTPIRGSAKGPAGWFSLTQAHVGYDHATHGQFDHALLVDFVNPGLGLGARVDRSRLLDLAARSGGAAYFPDDTATLTANYDKILDELRRRYVIGYESTNRDRNGKWRAIEVGVKGGGVLIRSRGGYFAPAE